MTNLLTPPWCYDPADPAWEDVDLPPDDTRHSDDESCEAICPLVPRYFCTLRYEHKGDLHRAGTGKRIVAEWPVTR